jgi:hypothetical protein
MKIPLLLQAAAVLIVLLYGDANRLLRMTPDHHPPSKFMRSFNAVAIIEPLMAEGHTWSLSGGTSANSQIGRTVTERTVQPMFYTEPQYRLAIFNALHTGARQSLIAMHAQVLGDTSRGSDFRIVYRCGTMTGEISAGSFREMTNGRISAHQPGGSIPATIEIHIRETTSEPLSKVLWENLFRG